MQPNKPNWGGRLAGLIGIVQDQLLTKQALVFTCLQYKSFENTVGKGELLVTSNLPFPKVFSVLLENFLPFSSNLKLSSANSSDLEESKLWERV